MGRFSSQVLLLLVFVSMGWHAINACCPNSCNGKGTCDKYCQCSCYDGYTGGDCSLRTCPSGEAWSDIAYATDYAHAPVECSNRGICDREIGECTCMEGFVGSACERLSCPADCNDNGKCYSMHNLALETRNADSTSYTYETAHGATGIWDANKIHGCVCDAKYGSYDCGEFTCVRGDDPLTTGEVNEIQLVTCTATAGSFVLYYKGSPSTSIAYSATAAQMETALESIKTITDVTVTYSDSFTQACQLTTNVISIEFTEQFGEQSPLVVVADSSLTATGSVAVSADGTTSKTSAGGTTYTSVKGTKENALCAGRGLCTTADGTCSCFDTNGDSYGSSNGYGAAGTRGDCGFITSGSVVSTCPGTVECSGHGICATDGTYVCSCEDGWQGGDCSERSCPIGLSWFSYPTANEKAHFDYATCSNMGTCDPALGVCLCRQNFYGQACEFMGCGGGLTTPCNGNGRCMTMKELALFAENNGDATTYTYGADPNEPRTWDADRIHGCHCDEGYTGYDCSLRTCPTGDDPATYDDHVEVQLLTCSADAGYFTLTFRQHTTANIQYNATADEVRDALMKLPSMSPGGVVWQTSSINSALAPYSRENGEFEDKTDHYPLRVYYTLDGAIPYGVMEDQIPHKTRMDGDPFWESLNATTRNGTHHFCNTTSPGNTVVIVFDAIHGNVPAITADVSHLTKVSGGSTVAGSVSVYTDGNSVNDLTSLAGTTEDVECNNRGICDRDDGKCTCFATYSSSDGKGLSGYIGDCGYRNQHKYSSGNSFIRAPGDLVVPHHVIQ